MSPDEISTEIFSEKACSESPSYQNYFCNKHLENPLEEELKLDDTFIGITNHYKKKSGIKYEFSFESEPKKRLLDDFEAKKYPSILNEYLIMINTPKTKSCNTLKDS